MGYAEGYENSLHFSPRFQQYALSKAGELVERYNLHQKDILEIGSGRGDFLKMLVELGNNRGIGFDPSYAGPPPGEMVEGITFIQDYYSDKYTNYPADFVLSRHVLEHIPEPGGFLSMLRQVIGERQQIVVFFEVPNGLYTLHEMGIWDVIYEHYSYFNTLSLTEAFRKNGFKVLRTAEAFENQYLTIEAGPATAVDSIGGPDPAALQVILAGAQRFAEKHREKVSTWRNQLNKLRQNQHKAVIWGAGSKGITFLNTFDAQDVIEYVVDINPRKEGKFVSGGGQTIVPPDFLQHYQPEVVIIMNPNYKEEIQGRLKDLGVKTSVIAA